MYCPRCGSQNTETTKYCRQCGLPLQQVSGYVATGGTGALAQPLFQSQAHQPQLNAPGTNPLAEISQGSIVEDETRKLPEQR